MKKLSSKTIFNVFAIIIALLSFALLACSYALSCEEPMALSPKLGYGIGILFMLYSIYLADFE